MKNKGKSPSIKAVEAAHIQESREERLKRLLAAVPTEAGVYLMKDERGHVIYVGKAKNLRSRVRSYFQKQGDHSAKTIKLVSEINDMDFLQAGNEIAALLLENTYIKKYQPRYNIRLRDDKTYPFLRLDVTHPFPRPYLSRKQTKDGAEYFGPFVQAMALHTLLEAAAKVFLLRDCKDRDFANRSRPCLSYEIGQCSAPCVNYVTPEQYAQQVADFRKFVKGETEALEAHWTSEMNKASEQMRFEDAAALRDRIARVRSAAEQQRQQVVDTEDTADRDVWSYWPRDFRENPGWLDVLVLQIRGGKWSGRVHHAMDMRNAEAGEDFFAGLALQHYTKHPLPAEILTEPCFFPTDLEARTQFAEALMQVSKVEGREQPPQVECADEKQVWAKLLELAEKNAQGVHSELEAVRARREDSLLQVARLLDLQKPPHRMECIDISNMQGEANVASCVVFIDGKPATDQYRHYKVQGFSGQNDFASMKEVLTRRYAKPDSQAPDLLVLDGGKGQLSAAMEILEDVWRAGAGAPRFPVVALAKARVKRDFKSSDVESSEERLFLPGQKNDKKIKEPEALRVLTHLRDEAHRFAITFHRKKRDDSRFE